MISRSGRPAAAEGGRQAYPADSGKPSTRLSGSADEALPFMAAAKAPRRSAFPDPEILGPAAEPPIGEIIADAMCRALP
jgi:hypothetical protein